MHGIASSLLLNTQTDYYCYILPFMLRTFALVRFNFLGFYLFALVSLYAPTNVVDYFEKVLSNINFNSIIIKIKQSQDIRSTEMSAE